MKQLFLLSLLLLRCLFGFSQNVAINNDGSQPHASAMLDIKSTTKGLLIPRMTAAEKGAVQTPASGLLVYQTDGSKGFYYYDGSAWLPIASAVQGALPFWSLGGNSGTDSTVNFIGTTDNQPLIGKAGGTPVFKFTTSGKQSLFLGFGAGSASNGYQNVAIGVDALKQSVANNNIALGTQSLKNNTTGIANTAAGVFALGSNLSGNYNVAQGYHALNDNSNGSNNTGIGVYALGSNTTGGDNIAIGSNTLGTNTIGYNNIAIGQNADVESAIQSNSIAIGKNAVVGYSNSVVFGEDAASGSALLKVGIGKAHPAASLHIKQLSSAGSNAGIILEDYQTTKYWRTYLKSTSVSYALGYNYTFNYNGTDKGEISSIDGSYGQSSDLRLKKDIQPVGNVLPRLMQLQAKTYHYKDNPEGARLSYGFIAQEVEPLFPEFVSTNAETGMKGLAYSNFGVIAVEAIKEQQQIIHAQQQKIDALEADLKAIKQKLGIQ